MIIIINPENEMKVLTILVTYRNFLRTDKIVFYTRLPKHIIEEIRTLKIYLHRFRERISPHKNRAELLRFIKKK